MLVDGIFTEWLPSSGYEKSMNYEIQVYGPVDTQKNDYTCEICISVVTYHDNLQINNILKNDAGYVGITWVYTL